MHLVRLKPKTKLGLDQLRACMLRPGAKRQSRPTFRLEPGGVTLVGHQPAQGEVFFLASAHWDPE